MLRPRLSLLRTGMSRCVWSHSDWRTNFGSSGSPNTPATASPLNPHRQPEEEEVRTRTEEPSTRRLDVSWDVGVLHISTGGKEAPYKLLDVLISQVDEVGDPA